MSPVPEDNMWRGADVIPNSTEDIKLTKSALVDGHHLSFREGGTIIRVRQGPGARKRTAPFWVLLSVIAVRGEHVQLAKKIGRAKWIYLIKDGEPHQTYASFHHYKMPVLAHPPAKPVQQGPNQVSKFAHSSSHITTQTSRALSYGGDVIALQSLRRITRHVAWLRHPIVIPIVVVVEALAGATPPIIAEMVMAAATWMGGKVLSAVKNISTAWLGGPGVGSFPYYWW